MKIGPQQLLRRLTTDLNGPKPYDFHSVCTYTYTFSQQSVVQKLKAQSSSLYVYDPFFISNKSQRNLVMSGVIEYLMEMHFALVASFVCRQKNDAQTISHMANNQLHAPILFSSTFSSKLYLEICQQYFSNSEICISMSTVFF